MSHKKISNKRLCLLIDVAMLLMVAAFVCVQIMKTPKSHYDVDRHEYPLKGIDVSAHNGEIDFMRVMADSVSFVMIKATEGTDFCDAKFSENYLNAKATGLKVGAYHFFRFDTPGDVQAQHFLTSVNGRELDMPLAIDVEKWGNPQNYDVDHVKANLRTMVSTIKDAGYPLMIYTNKHGYHKFIEGSFDDVPLWICSLSCKPNVNTWVLWQHSHKAHVDGVEGHVDTNTYRGGLEDFQKWTDTFTINQPYTAHIQ